MAPQPHQICRQAPRSRSLPPLQRSSCLERLDPPVSKGSVHLSGSDKQAPTSSVGEVLVYVDVDGVLNTTEGRAAREHLNNSLIASLRRVMDAVPDAAIVVSSSWRNGPPLMEALEARLTAEGIAAPVAVTGQVPLPEKDPNIRGDLEAELARLAAQRAAEIQASVLARRPRAWIAIDDLDLRPPSKNTLHSLSMGYPGQVKGQSECGADGPVDENGRALPPVAARRPFTLRERRTMLPPKHPLTAQLPRRRRTSHGAKGRLTDKWIDPPNFVHTSEAEGLTKERADFAIDLLRAQLENHRELARMMMNREYS